MSHLLWYTISMNNMKTNKIKGRVNKHGFMGSATREHRVKKGKGSFRRREKHSKKDW